LGVPATRPAAAPLPLCVAKINRGGLPMVFGQCKDMTIKFVNDTGLTVTIPSEGHKVRNPGGLEGWNNMTLGGSVVDLAPGGTDTVRQTLNIKCVDDAEFEIHYTADGGGDFTQVFSNKDIKDKNAVLTLTNH
jgi:hypothetical protein